MHALLRSGLFRRAPLHSQLIRRAPLHSRMFRCRSETGYIVPFLDTSRAVRALCRFRACIKILASGYMYQNVCFWIYWSRGAWKHVSNARRFGNLRHTLGLLRRAAGVAQARAGSRRVVVAVAVAVAVGCGGAKFQPEHRLRYEFL